MALKYVVTKRVFGFDKTNTEKYVAKSVGSGKMNFVCAAFTAKWWIWW